MLSNEIATYLAASGLGLTVGVNLFAVPFPATAPPAAVYVALYAGEPSERSFGPSLTAPIAEHPRFQVMVRDVPDRAAEAEQLAHDVYKKLDGLGPVTLSGVLYHDVRSLDGPPKFLSFDQNDRPRFYCNYEATKERS